ncbi:MULTISPECIES: hypothetical protein [Aerococcus]|uniref:Uncharacterized protein n=1 Tax=Aerococcus sanguinicola TaxID=119206 RepID=A0A5N1GFI2_9LACT|nr:MULTISPECIES: hypothetical protein [Aerococcus]KAA9299643.1 hypothetical protein F6I03_09240 [Aerococcus sanguinicola]MDK6369968.1 hypothetical protein [Aerococcus sp. UMB9870]MDK6680558.1 hypothetical protein [Aerococcus sp. UMB8608]MDK6687388.1 hypothetical protein [Aerococcus sp. UMB8623]MDK6940491.1 hypothetical protein [Aerococcus sp. UMB8487]
MDFKKKLIIATSVLALTSTSVASFTLFNNQAYADEIMTTNNNSQKIEFTTEEYVNYLNQNGYDTSNITNQQDYNPNAINSLDIIYDTASGFRSAAETFTVRVNKNLINTAKNIGIGALGGFLSTKIPGGHAALGATLGALESMLGGLDVNSDYNITFQKIQHGPGVTEFHYAPVDISPV